MSEKKRILFIGEASSLNTGFSTYYRELLPRLAATNKYELAEIGCYVGQSDPRWHEFVNNRWKIYGVMPESEAEYREFQKPDPHPRAKGQNTAQFGSQKFPFAVSDFKPDIVVDIRDNWMCLTPGNNILTSDGIKKIEDIEVGDKVLTHTGKFKKVLKLLQRDYSGKVITFKSGNIGIPVTVTTGHPILSFKRKKSKCMSLPNFTNLKLDWINSEEISKYDMVSFPKLTEESHLDIPDSLARLIGYYAAEGCLMYDGRKSENKPKGIQLVFHVNEVDYINECLIAIKEHFNIEAKLKNKGNATIIRAFGKNIAEYFQKMVPGLSGTKKFHHDIICSKKDIILQVLCGLFRGDGCINDERGSYCTKSLSLAFQTFLMLTKFNAAPTFNLNKNKIKEDIYNRYIFSFTETTLEIYSQIYNGIMPDSKLSAQRSNDKFIHFTIKNIIESTYSGKVYNFEVEDDNSYVSSFILHNCEFIHRSPFRPYFKFIWMPTVDSVPQLEEWISDYEQCNLVLSYSDFGINALKRSSPRIKIYGKPMRPGVDLNVFKNLNKEDIRQEWLGLKDPDIKVIGCTMRNQSRKLFPDIIDAFALMKNKYGGLEKEEKDRSQEERIVNKALLLLHTSWPDNAFSYDYPRHIARLQSNYYGCDSRTYYKGIKNDVLNTFICYECNHVFASWAINLYNKPLEQRYNRAKIWIPCQKCGKLSAATPDTSRGYTREQLAEVYNLMDLYCQVSIAEGDGMPIQEAKACLRKGSKILTNQGYKKIEDIQVGDLVLTSNGKYHPVIELMSRNYSGDMITIKPRNIHIPVTMTADHEVLTITKNNIDDNIGLYNYTQANWIPAKNLKARENILLYPIYQKNHAVEQIDIAEYLDSDRFLVKEDYVTSAGYNQFTDKPFENSRYKKIPRFIKITPEFAKLIGYYISEGWSNIKDGESGITFVFHASETKFHKFVLDSMKSIFHLDGKTTIVDNTARIDFSCASLAMFLATFAGHLAENKFISQLFFDQPNNIQSALLSGIWNGDGSDFNYKGVINGGFGTASQKLCYDVFMIMLQLGYMPELSYNRSLNAYFLKIKGNQVSDFKKYISEKPEVFAHFSQEGILAYCDDKFAYFEVGEVEVVNNQEAVYNVQVNSDHTYVTESFLTHNCHVPTLVMDHSAMAEKGRFPSEYIHLKDVKQDQYTINKGGLTINVDRHYYEPETSQRRCLPDLEDLADKMFKIITNNELRNQMSKEAHECIIKNYDWDKLSKEWEYVLDNVKPLDRNTTWDKPHNIQQVETIAIPDNLSNEQFIDWLYLDVLKYDKIDESGKEDWLAAMKAGQTRDQVLNFFKKIASQQVDLENYKAQLLAQGLNNPKLGELI